MKQYFRNRATSLKRRINLRFINRRFILRLRYLSDEVAKSPEFTVDTAVLNAITVTVMTACILYTYVVQNIIH